ncbi:MAG: hypothetical protein ACRERC_17020 [Candidatus Binatia bacterium]
MTDWISAVANVFVAAAAGVGAFTAWRGLNTWRAELRGRNEYDLARRVLLALYRTREAIQAARSPSMSSVEYESRPDRRPHDRPWSGKDMRYAYQQRWSRISAALVELDADLLEAEALWGATLKNPRTNLQKCLAELGVNITKHLRAHAPDDLPFLERKPMTPDEIEANDAIVWNLGEGNDVFGDRVAAAVHEFEAVLRPHLRR